MEVLRFVSNIAPYDVPDDATPHDAIVDGLRVTEEWRQHPDNGLPIRCQGLRCFNRVRRSGSLSLKSEEHGRTSASCFPNLTRCGRMLPANNCSRSS